MPPNERPQAIRLQIEKNLHYPVEEACIDFYEVASEEPDPKTVNSGKKSDATYESHEYIVACAMQETIKRLIEVGKRAGIRILSISAAPVSIRSAYRSLLGGEDTAIIYLGKHSTNIAVFKGKEIFLNREISLGGDSITSAMTGTVVSKKGKIELNFAAAEKLKLEEGIPLDFDEYTKRTGIPGDELYAMMRPAVERIGSEIKRSFDYFGLKGLRIIVTGGASQTKQLPEAISKDLNMSVEKTDPPIKAENFPKKGLAQLSAAIGAAIDEGANINLLPDEYKNTWLALAKKLLRNPVYPAFATAAVAVLVFFYQAAVLNSLQKDLAQERAKYSAEEPALRAAQAISRSLQGPGDIAGDQFVAFLDKLESFIPSDTWLTKIEYSRPSGKLVISGIAAGAVTQLANSLKAGAIINSAEITQFSNSKDREGYFEFSILCGINK